MYLAQNMLLIVYHHPHFRKNRHYAMYAACVPKAFCRWLKKEQTVSASGVKESL